MLAIQKNILSLHSQIETTDNEFKSKSTKNQYQTYLMTGSSILMKSVNYGLYDDQQLVSGILNNDGPLIEYFFLKKCSKLFTYILLNVFYGKVDKRELVSELYLFMAHNNWQVFRNFQYRSSLMTYISVVAVRFFQKKRRTLIENTPQKEQNDKSYNPGLTIEERMDLQSALHKMPNVRYRQVIEMLDLQDIQPETVAKEMNITVDNLYNIHRRALVQLRLVMGRKEDYYG